MQQGRILSIDIFRGLTIFLMVFVNELAGVSAIPAWMKHVPAGVDGMTFVDVVFPAFLFIVGMAIPFAVRQREKKGDTPLQFWGHVLQRTLGLLVLGFYMVNAEEMNAEATLIPKRLWSAALYLAAILIWNRYPKPNSPGRVRLYRGLQLLGVAILIALWIVYRKGAAEPYSSMTPSWWGILGLIGWAYLIAILLYHLAQKTLLPSIGLFVLFLGLWLGLQTNGIEWSGPLLWLKEQSGHLSHTTIVFAGVICSLLLSQEKASSQQKILHILGLGVFLGLVGYFSQPLGGISKIGATPAWSMYSASICACLFPLIYWMVDLKGISKWANFLTPAGKNPLLTYILPAIFYALLGYSWVPVFLTTGVWGIMRALVFSFFMLWITDVLTKRGIQLQL